MLISYKKPLNPIDEHQCPNKCREFFERRQGIYGPYYYCKRCQHTIPENKVGLPAEPVQRCRYCRGLVFRRTLQDGDTVLLCWSHTKHRSKRNKKISD